MIHSSLPQNTIQPDRDYWGMAKTRLACFRLGFGNESLRVNLISNTTVSRCSDAGTGKLRFNKV